MGKLLQMLWKIWIEEALAFHMIYSMVYNLNLKPAQDNDMWVGDLYSHWNYKMNFVLFVLRSWGGLRKSRVQAYLLVELG